MNNAAQPLSNKNRSASADWQIPAALLALTAIPFVAGIVRLISLASGAAITPDNARFFAAPLPVILHIISVSLFCILGAFQFAPGFRRRSPGWHRTAGKLLMISGLISGLSGLWMTQFYQLHLYQLQGNLLYGFRMLIGSAMVGCIAISWAAIRRRDIARHRAWIIRGYAIGQGAGTQVLTMLPWFLLFGTPSKQTRDILMIAAWVINLLVAELIIRKQLRRGRVEHPQSANLAPKVR